jgi:flagellar hook assembly protein FlgD
LKNNPDFKNSLIELDAIGKRYSINPAEIICDEETSLDFKVSLLRKIAEVGSEWENEQMEKAEREAKLKQRR